MYTTTSMQGKSHCAWPGARTSAVPTSSARAFARADVAAVSSSHSPAPYPRHNPHYTYHRLLVPTARFHIPTGVQSVHPTHRSRAGQLSGPSRRRRVVAQSSGPDLDPLYTHVHPAHKRERWRVSARPASLHALLRKNPSIARQKPIPPPVALWGQLNAVASSSGGSPPARNTEARARKTDEYGGDVEASWDEALFDDLGPTPGPTAEDVRKQKATDIIREKLDSYQQDELMENAQPKAIGWDLQGWFSRLDAAARKKARSNGVSNGGLSSKASSYVDESYQLDGEVIEGRPLVEEAKMVPVRKPAAGSQPATTPQPERRGVESGWLLSLFKDRNNDSVPEFLAQRRGSNYRSSGEADNFVNQFLRGLLGEWWTDPQYRTPRFFLRLAFAVLVVPYLMTTFCRITIINPVLDARLESHTQWFAITEQQEAVVASKVEGVRQRMEYASLMGRAPQLSGEEFLEVLRLEGEKFEEQERGKNKQAFQNVLSDTLSASLLMTAIVFNRKRVSLLKAWLGERFLSMEASTQAFTLLLVADILVGYHSSDGWITAINLVLHHYGLAENEEFTSIFVATVPVALDVTFKYWVFKVLRKIAPSTQIILSEIEE